MATTIEAESALKPKVVTSEEAQQGLQLPQTNAQKKEEISSAILEQADKLVKDLLAIESTDLREQDRQSYAVTNLGIEVQNQIRTQSKMLSEPMHSLVSDAQDGGAIGRGLLDLQEQVNKINPSKFDFTMGAIRRLLAMLPGVGTPIARWFQRYQTVKNVIDDIVRQLKDGKSQLERDNNTLRDDQIRMIELTRKLTDYSTLGQVMIEKLKVEIDKLASDDNRRKFLEEEVLFPLNQRVIDIQQQLATNQIGAISSEVIIRNNRELIKGVDRSLNVTIVALEVASTLQVALKRQQKTLDAVQAVNETTTEILQHAAKTVKTQGVEIQKQSSTAQLDIQALKASFNDVVSAMDQISQFRRDALPAMAKSILEMDKVTTEMNDAMDRMEKGNQKTDALLIEIVSDE